MFYHPSIIISRIFDEKYSFSAAQI